METIVLVCIPLVPALIVLTYALITRSKNVKTE